VALTSRSRAVLVFTQQSDRLIRKTREAAELAEMCVTREMASSPTSVPRLHRGPGRRRLFCASRCAPLTFTLSGLSKIRCLPQMKMAWMVVNGPQPLVHTAIERLEIIADTYLSPSTPVQLALPTFLALRSGAQAQLQRRISTNLEVLDGALRESKLLTRLDREGGCTQSYVFLSPLLMRL